ncbi:MAG: response regulator transcription factor [Anaerolineales bacterium]|nr:response regulator transcription factor [Anaerolineales bacterium]
MKLRILWIEGRRAESPHFVPGLRKKGYIVETVATGDEAVKSLKDFDPDLIVVNAASMRTSGKRITRALRLQSKDIPLLLILGAENSRLTDPNADATLALPFTSRKLINRIRPLLPGDSSNTLHKGAIRLDLERKRVRCQGREASLTPRLAQLLKLLLERSGEVIEREELFRQLWHTEYTVDTRTLDVHISWLRQAIEEEPRKPRFLKTIRGVGYRLDV